MTTALGDVLQAVEGRVGYLRAVEAIPRDEDWIRCDRLDAGRLSAAVAAGVAARAAADAAAPDTPAKGALPDDGPNATDPDGGPDRQVVASLLAQSYAFRVGAISLAAYAIGLPWPAPAAPDTAVRLAKGRASGLALWTGRLGEPSDPEALAQALLDEHLAVFVESLRETTRIGTRLLWGNVAASCAAAFRAVEGAARDRGDRAERTLIQDRAHAWFAAADRWLGAAGRFERVELEGADGWYWTRTSCCLYFRIAAAKTCDDCSLIPAGELLARRQAELEGARR